LNTSWCTLEAIVRKHQSMVFSIALRMTGDRSASEEIVQDVFLALHRNLDNLASEQHVLFWLRKVTIHKSTAYQRRSARTKALCDGNVADLPDAMSDDDPLLAGRLRQLVANLPAHLQSVIVLRYQEDLLPQEIASVLAMPVATVKSNLQRGLELLRRKAERVFAVRRT
jgi:RNA polymerase sigma-70 factor, ECF subfamily